VLENGRKIVKPARAGMRHMEVGKGISAQPHLFKESGMKRRILFAGVLLASLACMVITTSVFAQPQPPQRQTPQERVDQMEKELKLTADQKAKILKVFTDAEAQAEQGGRRGFFGFGTPPEVEKILTPDQLKAWQAFTLKQSVDRRIAMMSEAVTLTDDQKAKIRPIIEKETAATTKLMAEMRAQGENADREAMRTKMGELRDATTKALESILTKEQMEKYNSMPRGGQRRQ